jgi:hypothetical protein
MGVVFISTLSSPTNSIVRYKSLLFSLPSSTLLFSLLLPFLSSLFSPHIYLLFSPPFSPLSSLLPLIISSLSLSPPSPYLLHLLISSLSLSPLLQLVKVAHVRNHNFVWDPAGTSTISKEEGERGEGVGEREKGLINTHNNNTHAATRTSTCTTTRTTVVVFY